MRQMAIQAGIGENLVYGIIKEGKGARPETLKALADRWGTEKDYWRMMELAGHPVPRKGGKVNPDDPLLNELIHQYQKLRTTQDQKRAVEQVRILAETQEPYEVQPDELPGTTQSASASP